MIAFGLTSLEFGNSYYASFSDKYAKDWERLQIVLCKYCSGDLQMREREWKREIGEGLEWSADTQVTSLVHTLQHYIWILIQSTDLVCWHNVWVTLEVPKVLENSILAFEKSGLHQWIKTDSFLQDVSDVLWISTYCQRWLASNRIDPCCRCCANSQKRGEVGNSQEEEEDVTVLFCFSLLVPSLLFLPSAMIPAVILFVLHSFLSLSLSPLHCHPTVPFDSPHERLQTPTAPLHLPPDHPPFLHLHPFLIRHLPLGGAPLQRSASSLAGQDLYAGALCHQRVPRPHPPHPTDLRLLPTFPRLPLHAAASEGEEDPKRGDFQRGDGWRIQGWGQEGEQWWRQGGGGRLWWWWQWVLSRKFCGGKVVFSIVRLDCVCLFIHVRITHMQQKNNTSNSITSERGVIFFDFTQNEFLHFSSEAQHMLAE